MKKQNIIGNILFSAILPTWTLLLATVMAIIGIIYNKPPYKMMRFWATSNLALLKFFVGLKVEYKNLPSNPKGLIIASEHQSALEIIALVAVIPNATFVLKRALMHIPIVGYAMKRLKMIPVSRKKFNAHWTDIAEQNLKNECNVIIFPEGTRTKFGLNIEYRKGVFKLAEQMQQKIIPVAVDTGKYWGRKSFFKKPGTAYIIFGNPIDSNPELMRKTVHELLPR